MSDTAWHKYAGMSQYDINSEKPAKPSRLPILASGTLLLVVSAVSFSTAGFFARSVAVDGVTMLFWRNLLGGIILLPWALRRRPALQLVAGTRTAAIIALSALASLSFIAAFSYTSVAKIFVVHAAAPMVTAAMAWIVLRERVAGRTLVAIGIAFSGVIVATFGRGLGQGTLTGDGLAMVMTLCLSAVAVLSREQSLPALALSCASSFLVAAVTFFAGPELYLTQGQFLWLGAFGAITMAVALPCYLLGLRTVGASRATLISALELPLAPFWVWLAVGEAPGLHAALGGSIVLMAIVGDLASRSR